MLADFRKVRAALDEFAPDFIVTWGDDQYENFREQIIPPSASSLLTRWSESLGPPHRISRRGFRTEYLELRRPTRKSA